MGHPSICQIFLVLLQKDLFCKPGRGRHGRELRIFGWKLFAQHPQFREAASQMLAQTGKTVPAGCAASGRFHIGLWGDRQSQNPGVCAAFTGTASWARVFEMIWREK